MIISANVCRENQSALYVSKYSFLRNLNSHGVSQGSLVESQGSFVD